QDSYGWGTLILAGGGAYYFAKKSINADRAAKAQKEKEKRMAQYQLEAAHYNSASPPANPGVPGSTTAPKAGPGVIATALGKGKGREREDKDCVEASTDPAPTRHAPEDEAQKVREKSKYEASDAYRSRKGDRFS
ncbi:hypothetical protein BDV96DRAFT_495886, partial [Lophiotrema nucula]